MKHFSLKLIGAIVCLSTTIPSFSQNNWTINGNGNTDPINNFLGTTNNFGMSIRTFGVERMHINQNRNSAIGGTLGGFNVITDGYVGIGPNTGNIWTNKGPFSLLHLNGGQVGALGSVQELGFRPWMQTGISFTGFNDFAYVGYRHVTGNTNEFVINWSNDPAVVAGPDDMVFRFTQGYDFTAPNPDDPLARIDNNFTASDDMDGRHIARFTPTGEFGLGPNFGHTFDNAAYVRPQSMFHMSTFQQQEAWMQVTNQTGTGETTNDGLRIGVTGTGTAHIKQQEELPLIFYTNNLSTARIVPEQSTFITSLGLANPGMMGIGDFTTPSLPIDAKLDIDGDLRIRLVEEKNTLTRVLVVDENDQNRVFYRNVDDLGTDDQNLTLLNGILSIEDGNSVDLSSLDTDTDQQMLSISGNILSISNGNSVTLPVGTGGTVTADNGLRIFPTNSGNVQLGQANTGGTNLTGGELLDDREIPLNNNSLLFSRSGRIGIGTFSSSKLTVKNDLDLANILLLKDEAGTNKVIVTDQGLTTINSLGGAALAVNLTTPSTGSNIVNIKALTTIDANFPGSNVTGIESSFITGGGDLSGRTVRGISSNPRNSLGSNIAYHTNLDFSTIGENIGLSANVSQGYKNYGANLTAQDGSDENCGVKITVGANGTNSPYVGTGTSYGVNSLAALSETNYAGNFLARNGSLFNYGIKTAANGSNTTNYGIYSSAAGSGSINWAGYFIGNVYISGTYGPSDIMLKDNVVNIDNATELINQLQPKTFDYKQDDFPTMNLSSGLQYGLIAQDVETILPDLITEVTQPAELDSLGNVVTPEINFKGLEYQQLIPILIAGFKEQQSKLDTKDSLIDNLQSEINYIKECLLNARICEEGNRTINQNPTTEINQRSIELINTNSIILDQNLPNPFAEHTVINYNIPDDVMEAKLMFYDFNGRIIKELIIEERGESKLTVYGTNLKTGVYTYSLIADGELIATKKMVKK